MAFHRLTVPSYTGGLPGGYDYINNATSGTPAPADGALGAGTYSGSYFFAFQGQVTALALNRAAQALAENCDYLDDLLRRDLAAPTIADFVAGGSPVSLITLTGPGVYIGKSGTPNTTAGLATLYQVVDQNDNEITNTGVECVVTAISDTVGNEFSAGNVDLTITPAIPAGVAYRVYYGVRSNLAALPIDALTSIQIRGAEEVPAELLGSGGAANVGYAGGGTWADGTTNPGTTVEGQLDKVISDLGSGTGGSSKISAAAYAGTYHAVSAGSVQDQVEELVGVLDTIQTDLDTVEAQLAQSPDIQVITATNASVTIPDWAQTVEFLVKGGGGGGAGLDPGSNVGGGGGSSGGGGRDVNKNFQARKSSLK